MLYFLNYLIFIFTDELITSNEPSVSSKRASCDENKDSVDSQISIVVFPTELLVGGMSQAAESLEVKNDKSSNVANFEQLKLNNKNDNAETKSEVKSDIESKKSNDDTVMEVEKKTNCKYVTDEKKSQVKMDDDDGKTGVEEEEGEKGTGISCIYFNEMCISILFFFPLYIKTFIS